MKFHYLSPSPDVKLPGVNERFLPSLCFVAFSRKEIDTRNYDLQGIYTRRIPNILKIKAELSGRFRTVLIIPIGRDKTPNYFLEIEPDDVWNSPKFLSQISRFDYLIWGSLSIDQGEMSVEVYSRSAGKVIYEREYRGDPDEFHDFCNNFTRDLFLFFEITPDEELDKIIQNRPVGNRESFKYFVKALDADPINNVDRSDRKIYVENLKKSIEADPASQDAVFLLNNEAFSCFREGSIEEARKIIDFILNLRPDDYITNRLRARMQIEESKIDVALNELEQLCRKDPEKLTILYQLGKLYTEKGKSNVASRLFQKAFDLGYNQPEFYEDYISLLAESEKFDRALEVSRKELEKYPDRKTALINTAQLLAETGKIEEANKIYEKAEEKYPDSAHVLTSRAIFYINNGQSEKASKAILSALDLRPEDPLINLEGARIFEKLKRENEAIRFARTALDLAPSGEFAAEAELTLSRIKAGISKEEQQENRKLYVESLRLLENGDFDECVRLARKISEKEPTFWNAWFLMGVAYRRMGKYEQALESLDRIDNQFKSEPMIQLEIGRCKMAQGEFNEALPHVISAYRENPDDTTIKANLGILFMNLRRMKEAEALLEQVKKEDPDNLDIEPYLEIIKIIKRRKKLRRDNGDLKEN